MLGFVDTCRGKMGGCRTRKLVGPQEVSPDLIHSPLGLAVTRVTSQHTESLALPAQPQGKTGSGRHSRPT